MGSGFGVEGLELQVMGFLYDANSTPNPIITMSRCCLGISYVCVYMYVHTPYIIIVKP